MPRKKKPELTFQRHNGKLTACRKSLIHECVTGQRRITEPPSPRSYGRPGADVKRVGMQSGFDKREAKP